MGGIGAGLHSGASLWCRRGGMMLAVMALVLATGAAALALLPKYHAAEAVLVIAPTPDRNDGAAQIAGEIELMRSDKVLRLAAARLHLLSDGVTPAAEQPIIAGLGNAITAERRGASYLVAVTARAPGAEMAANIANTLSQAFIDTELQTRLDQIDADRALLEARLADAETAMVKTDGALTASLTVNDGRPVVEGRELQRLRKAAEMAHDRRDVLADGIEALQKQKALLMPGARLVRAAVAPTDASGLNVGWPTAALAVASLIAGAAAGLLADVFTRGFVSDDIGGALGIRQAAVIPLQRTRRRDDGERQLSPADLLLDAPISPFAEAVRRMKASLDTALERSEDDRRPAGRGGIIMVTSALRGEGKTTLALALARAYALAGKATLLIDCDLRHPGLHHHLGLEPSGGLVDYLGGLPGSAGLRAILAVDEASGARVVVGGRGDAQATDRLFVSSNFSGLISAAAQNFDVVLLDTPPVGEMVDGLYLAGFVDAAALVVRWAATGRKPVTSAIEALQDSLPQGGEVLAVLNQRAGAGRAARTPEAPYRLRVPGVAHDNTNVIRHAGAINPD